MIKMLHSCDAGEYSILSNYPLGFGMADLEDGYSDFVFQDDPVNAMSFFSFRKDTKLMVIGGRTLDFNYLKRPFEVAIMAAGYNFSHGHLIKNAPFSSEF